MPKIREVKISMKDVFKVWHWPYLRKNSNGKREYACPHYVGHGGIHGCDGCCLDKSFKRTRKQ